MRTEPQLAIRSLTFDCSDPELVARFWAEALGYRIDELDEEGAIVSDPAEQRPRLLFLVVPEPKTVKNRLHFDLRGGDMESEVERLKGLGASVVQVFDRPHDVFTVMRDPEGNEFCVEQP